MAMNKSAIRILELLSAAGYKKDKQIEALSFEQILNIGKLSRNDMNELLRIQKAIKAGKIIEHINGADSEVKEYESSNK